MIRKLLQIPFICFQNIIFDQDIAEINLSSYKDFQRSLYEFLKRYQDPVISFFYSYIYSLLVTSDVIASSYADDTISSVEKYSKKWNNRITKSMEDLMKQNFYDFDYNQKYENISFKGVSKEEIGSSSNINDLRTYMLKEASLNLRNSLKSSPEQRIFYLNMPTGGGKTNVSMKLALDILENTDINRIIYAMPFINIIEQNYDVIKNNFGLDEDSGEIRKIYSASETIFSDVASSYKSEIIMKDSFFDYPVICTTFVSLFNALIQNKKKYKYSLASLTNSVIILDEIQSLPLKNWTSLYYLINESAKNYNIYFIIMSATLPKFDELKLNSEIKFDYTNVHLINEPVKYFSHPLFDRTHIDTAITQLELNLDDVSEISEYFNIILNKNFQKGYFKGLIVLNTILASKWVYKCLIKLKEEYNFEIDLLNSSIIPSEKKKIIHKINNMNIDSFKYILVSTQSVEAGVDVSFDFVVRDFATLDSIEQIRGRCNRSRELNKRFKNENKKGNVNLINLKRKNRFDHELIYDKEELETKIVETRKLFENNKDYKYNNVLDYYNSVSQNINLIQDANEKNFVFMDRNNIESWNKLKYTDLRDNHYGIHIIPHNNNQSSFFVATKMDIYVNSKLILNKTIEFMDIEQLNEVYKNNPNNFIFSLNEINFLKRYG